MHVYKYIKKINMYLDYSLLFLVYVQHIALYYFPFQMTL